MSSVDLPRVRLEPGRGQRLLSYLLGWVSHVGPFWAASVAAHLMVFVALALVLGTVHVARQFIVPPTFEAPAVDTVVRDDPRIENIKINESPLEPPAIDVPEPPGDPLKQIVDDVPPVIPALPPERPDMPGGNGKDFLPTSDAIAALFGSRPGAGPAAAPWVDSGKSLPGSGINDRATRFGDPGSGAGSVPRTPGVNTRKGAVIGALDWFKRHQARDGGWSLSEYSRQCKDSTCTGRGHVHADSAATAFAVLPYLAAGFTHAKGSYARTVNGGLFWLVHHQDPNTGSLAKASDSEMYSHGLATICLCEAFAMTHDKAIGASAQAAIKFIEQAQNKADGGWRYRPGQPGDTSVSGWQLMALKSGQIAGLRVDPQVIELGKQYLKAASGKSKQGGLFGYLPDAAPTSTMTAVGLLCTQYLGAKRDDPRLREGYDYLLRSLPDIQRRNSYYWYYATQVLYNAQGPDWDTWHRAVRRALINSQVKEGCAAGSWDPHKPVPDANADTGGRIMTTSLATLALEVYYRYLPLYTLDKDRAIRQ